MEPLQKIIDDGLKKLDFNKQSKEVILMLGNTGSGKSTTSLILNGNLKELQVKRTGGGKRYFEDDQNRIGPPTISSQTLTPEYMVNPENGKAFYDTPGFDDNRGTVTDIAAMYLLHSVCNHVSNVKFLIVETYSNVTLGNDKMNFPKLTSHVANFLLNINKFASSIGLIVTKVGSYDEAGDYLDDEQIMFGIVEYLMEFLKTLKEHKIEGELYQRKIKFVEALLRKNGSGHNSKIWFIRSPTKVGRLHEMDDILKVRSQTAKFYMNDVDYSPAKPTDFGFAIKDETNLDITKSFAPHILAEMRTDAQKVVDDLIESYQTEFKGNFKRKKEIRETLLKLKKIQDYLENFPQEMYQNQLIKGVQSICTIFGYPTSQKFLEKTAKNTDVLNFYEKVTMSPIAKPAILTALVSQLLNRVKSLRAAAVTDINEASILLLTEMKTCAQTAVDFLIDTSRNQFQSDCRSEDGVIAALLKLEKIQKKLQNFVHEVDLKQPLAQTVPILFETFGHAVPESFLEEIQKAEKVLQFHEKFTNNTIQRPALPSSMLSKLLSDVEGIKKMADKSNSNEVSRIFSKIKELTSNLSTMLWEKYRSNFNNELNRVTLKVKSNCLNQHIESLKGVEEKWKSFLESAVSYTSASSPFTISSEINLIYTQLGCSMPPEDTSALTKFEDFLDILAQMKGSPIPRPWEDWVGAPIGIIWKLKKLHDWCAFLFRVENELELYENQEQLHLLRSSTSVSNSLEAFEFLTKFSTGLVSHNIQEYFDELANDADKALLTRIVQNAFSPTYIEWVNAKDCVLAKGTRVKLSEVATWLSHHKSSFAKLRELKIFALEVLYIDANIEQTLNLTMRVVALRWELVGENRTIGLNGRDGGYPAAQHGPGCWDGKHGTPGEPGSNGGNFYGIYGAVEPLRKMLFIDVSGGNGGTGQDGQSGRNGKNGENVSVLEIMILVKSITDIFGCPGGEGGDGGTGGDGGYPGKVLILPVHSSSANIVTQQNRGRCGDPGNGGRGGLHGTQGEFTILPKIPQWILDLFHAAELQFRV